MTWGDLPDRIGRDRVVHEDEQTLLICARWQDVIALLPTVDATVTDPPYSAKTHVGMRVGDCLTGSGNPMVREGVPYEPWTVADAHEAVEAWSRQTLGWLVTVTDHVLAPEILARAETLGRYSFPPLPFVELGKQPRLTGDGPASWSCWIAVSRPATKAFAGWGSLPGAYVQRSAEPRLIKGGKPLWLMRALVNDYTREGALILDATCGAATTGRAAKDLGRRAILIEQDRQTCELAAKVLRPRMAWQQDMFAEAGE